MKFLRIVRIITFIGIAILLGLIIWKGISPMDLLDQAARFDGFRSYCTAFVLGCLPGYFVALLLTSIGMRIKGFKIRFKKNDEVLTVQEFFVQNELKPFWQFLTDTYDKVPSPIFGDKLYRFPYNIDMAYGMSVWKHRLLVPIAFLYRVIRFLLLSVIIVVAYLAIVNSIATGSLGLRIESLPKGLKLPWV